MRSMIPKNLLVADAELVHMQRSQLPSSFLCFGEQFLQKACCEDLEHGVCCKSGKRWFVLDQWASIHQIEPCAQ